MDNPNIPILGQTHKVYECVPVTTMQCNCRPDNPPFTIAGVDVAKICNVCKAIYGVIAVSFDRSKGDQSTTVTVGLIGRNQEPS